MYLYTQSGNENSITTGNVSMSYTESTNVISITNALPTSSAEGMMQSEYFDFSVTSNLELNENAPVTPVYYEIILEPLGVDEGYNALTDNQIKVYLEDVTNGTSVMLEPTLVSSAEVSENNTSYKILYSTSHNHSYGVNSITTKYRLRAWIDYNVDASTWSETNLYEYKFRVNVNSNADYVGYIPPSPEYCFYYIVDETNNTAQIYDYYCYEGNTYGYETITDVVIPETLNGYTVISLVGGDFGYGYFGAFQNKKLTSVVIPDSVTRIGNYAFYKNNLTSVILGNSLTTIEKFAFMDNNLSSVAIPDSVTTIGANAFENNNLTSVTIGSGLTSWGSSMFLGNQITNVKFVDGLSAIADDVFANQSLTSVEIPDSVTRIGAEAFRNNNLTTVRLGSGVATIGAWAFSGNNLTSIEIPDSVTNISSHAFQSNNLTSVEIPDSVTTVAGGAFNNNNFSDEEAYIYARTDTNSDGIAEIDYSTIISYGGSNKNPVIPTMKEGIELTEIEGSAFYENNLESVEIPDSVTTIGDHAFAYNNLTSVVIPDSVKITGNYVFYYNNLTSVEIPDSVTVIEEYVFSNNNLTSVTIPDSVTTIGGSAFSYNNLSYVYISENSSLTVTTGIGYDAFSASNRTSTITLDDGTIKTYVDNPNLTVIYNNSGKKFKWYYATQGRQNSTSSTYNFITGTVPSYTSGSYTYNEVLITTGNPE